jgi:hypothetical protein
MRRRAVQVLVLLAVTAGLTVGCELGTPNVIAPPQTRIVLRRVATIDDAESWWGECLRAAATMEQAYECDRVLVADVTALARRDADASSCASRLDARGCSAAARYHDRYCNVAGRRFHWQPPESFAVARDVDVRAPDSDCQPIAVLIDAQKCSTAKYYDLAYCDDLERHLDGEVLLWTPIAPELRARLERIVVDSTPLRDDRAWMLSEFELCAAPEVSTDCDGVLSYLVRFPSGLHAARATELLSSTAALREKLAQRETSSEAKSKACLDDCVKRCTALGVNGLDCNPRCRTRCA